VEEFIPFGPLWRRPVRQAVRTLIVFGVAMTVAAFGALWWVHESSTQVIRTIGLILAVSLATDLVRYWWWRRAAGRQPMTGQD
jgi:hypothetical protein